ncbi:MAG: hypothetical protein C0502_03200 [Opitutus sp.]|nr:hypothetical protein [Opitutus sp.]
MFVNAPRFTRAARDWFAPPLAAVTVPLGCFAVLQIIYLWPEWAANPDLSHGFFAPLLFALLLREGTKSGPARWLVPAGGLWVAAGMILLAALLMLGLGGLLAASVGWSHAVVKFALTAAFAGALLAGWLVLATEPVRAIPFNWAIFTAIALWLLAAPLPTGTYARLTLALQGTVTSGVLHALHILGIPARQSGNIIELAMTSVGVEEACSGIRSLISCLHAGFFFAAWLVRKPGRRIVLIVLAPLLAVAMNFARSLALTLLANRGVDILGFWHDATGYAILGLTAAILGGVASLLSPPGEEAAPATVPVAATPPRAGFAVFTAGLATLVALGGIFVFLSRSSSPPSAEVRIPVASLLPAEAAGWQVASAPNLYRFSGILQTEHLVERTYFRIADTRPVRINIYVAHWSAGAASVSLVASHTPDACWPGAGWQQEPAPDRQVRLDLAGAALPVAEHRIFRQTTSPQHVWFWHLYNGAVINYRDPYSIPALVELALRYGFRREGPQYFIRLSSNLPWEQLRDEPLVREIFANLGQVGLRP